MLYILIGSVTTAMRLKRLIEHELGINADVVRTPSKLHSGGCSYSVRCDARFLNQIKEIVAVYGIIIRKIYAEEKQNGERVYNVIS